MKPFLNFGSKFESGTEAARSWLLVINWPSVTKAPWQKELVGNPGLIFKGPTGAIKLQVKSEELDFYSGFRG